jgi:PTS system mannose-specific IIB component
VIVLVRVDNRLIHGQVVEAWLPHLKVQRVVVADDEAAQSPLIRAAMGLAVPSAIEVIIEPLDAVDFARISTDEVRTLVLLREVKDVLTAQQKGLELSRVNLGNVHFATGRRRVTPSIFLTDTELNALADLATHGVAIEARSVPAERALGPVDIQERFQKEAGA